MIVEFHKCKFSTFCTTKRLEEKYQLIPNYWELNVSFNCHKCKFSTLYYETIGGKVSINTKLLGIKCII